MPAMHYTVRWPDARETDCYSPSLVIQDVLTPGADYSVVDFMQRVRGATAIADERVQAKFGFVCSRANDQHRSTGPDPTGYDIPNLPACSRSVPNDIVQVHSVAYRNAAQLPEGAVLVVGSGQSGVQIMEDLHIAGRQVHMAVGSAPRSPRVYRGRESTEWLNDLGFYALTVDRHPLGDEARHKTNHYMSGRDGGHEIDLRQFALKGVKLYGTLADIQRTQVAFRPDLTKNLDEADEVYCSIRKDIDAYIAKAGIAAPIEPPFRKVWEPAADPTTLDLRAAGITSIVWASGFKPDYAWIDLPTFDGRGHPRFARGVSPVSGLYFVGLPWLHTWGSGRFLGMAEDAKHLVDVITARRGGERWEPAATQALAA